MKKGTIKGLVYKDMVLFFKGVDRKLIFLAAGVIALLLYSVGVYAGILASAMLAMTIGIQNVMGAEADEKAGWKQYQMAMPVSSFQAVAGKYLSVLCTLAVSLAGSILCNLVASVVYRSFIPGAWLLSAICAVLLPLAWTGCCLPFVYWFGFRAAQTCGILLVIPMFTLVKYFEDGPGFQSLVASFGTYLALCAVGTVVLFAVSLGISVAGYRHRR